MQGGKVRVSFPHTPLVHRILIEAAARQTQLGRHLVLNGLDVATAAAPLADARARDVALERRRGGVLVQHGPPAAPYALLGSALVLWRARSGVVVLWWNQSKGRER